MHAKEKEVVDFILFTKIQGLFSLLIKYLSCMPKNNYLSFSFASYVYTGFLRVCNCLHTNEVYNHEKDLATAAVKVNSSCAVFIVLSLYSGKTGRDEEKKTNVSQFFTDLWVRQLLCRVLKTDDFFIETSTEISIFNRLKVLTIYAGAAKLIYVKLITAF